MKNKNLKESRRKFIVNTGVALSALSLSSNNLWSTPAYISNLKKPNSLINGVQIGLITYSFRELPDQNAESILEYTLSCGVSGVELWGDVAEVFAGKPKTNINMRRLYGLNRKKDKTEIEQKELNDLNKQRKSAQKSGDEWRKKTDFKKFEKLAKMYKEAGVKIYAYKPDYLLRENNSDDEINFAMKSGKILGASHLTVELPKESHSLRLGKLGEKNNIYVAYHGHEQQTPTFWDNAIKQSSRNTINIDMGHYIAGGNTDPLKILKEKNEFIQSVHIKDRMNPENGKKNMVWGEGDTPIKEILNLMRSEKYTFPASVEYEYKTPENSTIIKEVKKCVDYCKNILES
jgi:sugar phosphate isomerase/epimerase/predicted peroxiredoxin